MRCRRNESGENECTPQRSMLGNPMLRIANWDSRIANGGN
jgi:hypothetical protein